MCTSDQQKPRTDVCGLCQQPLADGDDVVQIVQDRHPTYDREVVLHTYHKSCCDSRETVTHDCPHCGCWFHIALLREGGNGAGPSGQLHCPFCGRSFDSNQEGQTMDGPNRDGSAVPTIVIFVSGGLVQGIEGHGAVRAIVCDFDNDEGPDSVGGRPCTIGVWEAPEPPSEGYAEAVRLANLTDDAGSADEKS